MYVERVIGCCDHISSIPFLLVPFFLVQKTLFLKFSQSKYEASAVHLEKNTNPHERGQLYVLTVI